MKQAKTALAVMAIGTGLAVSGCSTTPKAVAEADASGQVASATANATECAEECDDGGTNRYQYYLGILSVFLFN